jgi:hypothetical protein
MKGHLVNISRSKGGRCRAVVGFVAHGEQEERAVGGGAFGTWHARGHRRGAETVVLCIVVAVVICVFLFLQGFFGVIYFILIFLSCERVWTQRPKKTKSIRRAQHTGTGIYANLTANPALTANG